MSLRKSIKRLGRKTAKIHVKVNRVFTPVVAAGASFFYGPAAGAAVTAAGAQASYYFRGTQARAEGTKGRAARELGRGERKRVAIYGAAGTGAGALGAGLTTAFNGGTLGQSLSSGLFGQHGSAILGNTGSIFATQAPNVSGFVTAGTLAAQKSSAVPGLVTQSQLASSLAGGSTPTELAAAAAGGVSTTDKLITSSLGLLSTYAARPASTGQNGNINPNSYGGLGPDLASMFGGGGGGGEAGGGGGFGGLNSPMMGEGEKKSSSGLALALVVGALLLVG